MYTFYARNNSREGRFSTHQCKKRLGNQIAEPFFVRE